MYLLNEAQQSFPVAGAVFLVTVVGFYTDGIYGIHTGAAHKAAANPLRQELQHSDLGQKIVRAFVEFDKAADLTLD